MKHIFTFLSIHKRFHNSVIRIQLFQGFVWCIKIILVEQNIYNENGIPDVILEKMAIQFIIRFLAIWLHLEIRCRKKYIIIRTSLRIKSYFLSLLVF